MDAMNPNAPPQGQGDESLVAGTLAVGPIAPHEVAHREDFRDYVLRLAEPWHREHLGRLYELWDRWNRDYFDGRLVPPYILLSEPSEPNRYGDCGRVSGFGGQSQIRLRPSLLTGKHPHVRGGAEYAAGRARLVEDILLHEMIHQWHQEVTGTNDASYHGHGPAFRDECNRIGALLGLPRVRTMKKRGKDADLPSCSQWPHDVRPAGFYLGAYVRPEVEAEATRAETITVPTEGVALLDALTRLLSIDEARTLAFGLIDAFGLDPGALTSVPTRRDYTEEAA